MASPFFFSVFFNENAIEKSREGFIISNKQTKLFSSLVCTTNLCQKLFRGKREQPQHFPVCPHLAYGEVGPCPLDHSRQDSGRLSPRLPIGICMSPESWIRVLKQAVGWLKLGVEPIMSWKEFPAVFYSSPSPAAAAHRGLCFLSPVCICTYSHQCIWVHDFEAVGKPRALEMN